MRSNLRQQALGKILGRVLEEHSLETQSTASRLFDDARAFDGAIAALDKFRLGERMPDFFHERIMASFNLSQPAGSAWRLFRSSSHALSLIIHRAKPHDIADLTLRYFAVLW